MQPTDGRASNGTRPGRRRVEGIGDILLRPLYTTLEAHCLQAPFANVQIVPAECGGIALALGGVAAVLDDAFSTHIA